MTWKSLLYGYLVFAAAFSASPAIEASTPPAPKPRALLITGQGNLDPDHPQNNLVQEFYNDRIVRILEDIVDITVTEDLSTLNDANLSSYDIILNNSFLMEPTPEQFDAFYRFIERGKAYMTLHAGLVSFLNSDRYTRMMGGRMVGHSVVKDFTVETFEEQIDRQGMRIIAHPITRGMIPFETRDEIYVVQTNTDDLEVIARGESHPIVLLRRWGNGRVMAFTLGHADYSIDNAGCQALLQNSVRWLLGYPILEPIHGRLFPTHSAPMEGYVNLREITHHPNGSPLTYRVTSSNPDLVTPTVDEAHRLSLRFASGSREGRAVISVQAEDPLGRTDSTEFEIAVREPGQGNLSLYHGVTAHSSSNEKRPSTAVPAYVADGDPLTRWSSEGKDPSWIYLDLGDTYTVNRVRLLWEGAYAKQYEIQVSNDAQEWTTVHAQRNGRGGTEEIRFRPRNARYVRMLGQQRATRWGYSLYELEVYGAASRR